MAKSSRHFVNRFQHKTSGFSAEIAGNTYPSNPYTNHALLYDHDELNGKAPAKALSTLVTLNYDLALGTRSPQTHNGLSKGACVSCRRLPFSFVSKRI